MRLGKVHSVDELTATLLTASSKTLRVAVCGRTASTGWSGGELAQYVYLTPPADSVQEFDFVAERPADGVVVLPALTQIIAEASISNIDVENYWGPGKPLLGVRVHAVSNSKTALFADPTGMHRLTDRTGGRPNPYQPTEPPAAPSFATDIKPLFRPRDVTVMEAVAGWRLDNYEDVKANATKIRGRLQNGTMPCDGAWPQTDIDLFGKWIDGGMQP